MINYTRLSTSEFWQVAYTLGGERKNPLNRARAPTKKFLHLLNYSL